MKRLPGTMPSPLPHLAPLVVALFVLVVASPRPAAGAAGVPPERATDDAGGEETYAPLRGDASEVRADRRGRNVSLIGALRLGAPGEQGRVSAFKNLAFVNERASDGALRAGAHIVDISDPSAPVELATTMAYPFTRVNGAEAIRIRTRDILAVALGSSGAIRGRTGLELYDISDPATPRLLSFLQMDLDARVAVGVEQDLDVTRTRGGRTLALVAVDGLEAASVVPGVGGTGDLVIADITDPEHPTQVGEWGLLDEPALGSPILLGDIPDSTGVDVEANANGTRAYLSYWDAGTMILDISDPSAPRFLGRTSFGPEEEGNADTAAEARGGNVLVETTSDTTPFALVFTSNAFPGTRPVVEAVSAFTPPIASFPGRVMEGRWPTWAGAARPGPPGLPAGDPYLADPAGKIALIERGVCRFDHKVGRAALAGASGVIVYNSAPFGDALTQMVGSNPVTLPDGTVVHIRIPAVFAGRTTGLLLRDGTPPVTARVAAVFNGWGFVRVFNAMDPAAPVEVSRFKTPNSQDPDVALQGSWTPFHQDLVGNTVYVAWRNDGVRVLDVSQPAGPREIGFWTGLGAPADAPPVDIAGVVRHGELILASDRNFGLYVLRHTP